LKIQTQPKKKLETNKKSQNGKKLLLLLVDAFSIVHEFLFPR